MARKPNPGSREALARGCTCPVSDNARGQGAWFKDGKPQFWIMAGCPLHDTRAKQAEGRPTAPENGE